MWSCMSFWLTSQCIVSFSPASRAAVNVSLNFEGGVIFSSHPGPSPSACRSVVERVFKVFGGGFGGNSLQNTLSDLNPPQRVRGHFSVLGDALDDGIEIYASDLGAGDQKRVSQKMTFCRGRSKYLGNRVKSASVRSTSLAG
ncbi:MAG: hypothetical protein CM15mP120_21270 [Pseudomonadota bacterium]|nr:MAG: hypothetical protein CM15mP120_21270 [Pseudomonadota bacterium]